MKRERKDQPWLTKTGVEIPTLALKEIAKVWNYDTWMAYIDWHGSGRREAIVWPTIYQKKGEETDKSIFESFDQSPTPAKRHLCARILGRLPAHEAETLRLTYLEGLNQKEIGAELGRSRTGISYLKNTALRRLKRGLGGEKLSARRFMRGKSSKLSDPDRSIWDESVGAHPRDASKVYHPEKQGAEFEILSDLLLKLALKDLNRRARRILYLRYWCDYTIDKIARDILHGQNVVSQIDEAAISKVKRRIISDLTGVIPGGESCH